MMQATSIERVSGNLGHAAHELARCVSEATVIRCDEPLAKRTTLRVGGPADMYVEPANDEDLASVRMMDFAGSIREHDARELQVEYRSCAAFKSHIALAATLRVKPAPREVIEQRMNECSRKRWQSQPAAPSAGCMFKNPASIPA